MSVANTCTIPREVLERAFLARTDKTPDCWLWTGRLSGGWGKYGMLYLQRHHLYAHRVSYELFVGPISEGYEIDHLCRNRQCVNPEHLEAVTHRENLLRGQSPMAVAARAPACQRGHPKTPENTYVRKDGTGHMCRPCQLLRWRRENARKAA